MPTYVKADYAPEWNDYITAGKEYRVTNYTSEGGVIYGNDGWPQHIHFEASSHIDNRAWTVINRP